MSKEMQLAQMIRALKPGQNFQVKTESERQKVLRIGKSLKDAGVIAFDIITKKNEDSTFKVAAI